MLQDDQARATPFLKDFDNSIALYEAYAAEQKKQTQKQKRKFTPLDLAESNELSSGPLVVVRQVPGSEDSDGFEQPEATEAAGVHGGRRRRVDSRAAGDNATLTADPSTSAQYDFS